MSIDPPDLHWETVSPQLRSILLQLMNAKPFRDFRLVGGTALSLYLGHRMSIDIDLFTDVEYGSVDFTVIDGYLRQTFNYVSTYTNEAVGVGTSYYVGNSEKDLIKLDLFYTDAYIRPPVLTEEGLRIANVDDIIAMKVEVVANGGRMKDFWDLHELADDYSINQMLALHLERYPYGHDDREIRARFADFSGADEDFEPICLRGKHWEFIKLEILEALRSS